MEKLITVLVVVGGILGCVFVFLVEQSFTWRSQKKMDLVKSAEKAESITGFFAVLFIFVAVILSNI